MGSGQLREDAPLKGKEDRPRRRWRRWAVLVAVLLLLYFTHPFLLTQAGSFLDVSQAPAPADYVLVLSGGEQTRPFVAAALVKKKLARKVLVSRPKPYPITEDGLWPREEDVTRKVLLARGVADADILTLPGESGSTHAEAIALGRFLEENPGATVSVVTTNFHTRRARWIFRRVLGKRADGLRFVAAPTDGFDATNWWQFEAGFRTYSSEYLKLLVYVFRYSE